MHDMPTISTEEMPIELSDIYLEQMGKTQAKRYDIKNKIMTEDSD
jgi:hypothetical protein